MNTTDEKQTRNMKWFYVFESLIMGVLRLLNKKNLA